MATERERIQSSVSEDRIPADSKQTPLRTKSSRIIMAPAGLAEELDTVKTLVDIVNAVYGETEAELFTDGYQRTNTHEVQTYIERGEVALAFENAQSESSTGKPIGCIRIQKLSSTHGEFGMMAVDAKHRGGGYGREMVQFAEEHCRSLGLTVMQVELLYPHEVEHAFKQRLMTWYSRLGYNLVRLGDYEEEYPHLARLLKCPCEYRIFEKALT